MKRIVIAAILIVSTLIIIAAGSVYNMKTVGEVSAVLYDALSDSGDSDRKIYKAYEMWEKSKNTMLLFSSHAKLNQIGESIRMAKEYSEIEDMKMYHAECRRALIYLDQFSGTEYPTIYNIF